VLSPYAGIQEDDTAFLIVEIELVWDVTPSAILPCYLHQGSLSPFLGCLGCRLAWYWLLRALWWTVGVAKSGQI